MKLDEIHKLWAEDAKIDSDLSKATEDAMKQQQVWMERFNNASIRLYRLEQEHDKLLKLKYLWFEKKLSKERCDELGWAYDPFEGMKIAGAKPLEYFYKADENIQNSEIAIQNQKIRVTTLQEITKILQFRHISIKNMIDWKRFEAGF